MFLERFIYRIRRFLLPCDIGGAILETGILDFHVFSFPKTLKITG